jgi:O-antigen/teichoic acid export membrane protein
MTKKQDRRKNGIIDGAISLTLSTMVVKVLGLIYKIPLSHLLSDEGMGYFNSAYTVFALFYLLCTSGVPKAVMIIIIFILPVLMSASTLVSFMFRLANHLSGCLPVLLL